MLWGPRVPAGRHPFRSSRTRSRTISPTKRGFPSVVRERLGERGRCELRGGTLHVLGHSVTVEPVKRKAYHHVLARELREQ
jgi:hypothetical protein